jgi:cytochrome P450
VQRSPRVSDEHGFTYKDWTIPPGFPASMDNFHMHHNETIFPDSYTYKPERRLGNPKGPDGVKQLSRYMVAFGRGNRMCLGMPMAYCEIYITLASLMRRFEFVLFETDRVNVDFCQDFVTPQPKKGSLGVRVLVK